MNEFEARRAALTAAITWCSPAGESMSTDAMLGYAEQFEEWLTRPGLPGVVITDVPVIQLPDVLEQRVPHDPYMDGPEPDVPQQRTWTTCALCSHGLHPGEYCQECPCAHGRRPR